MRTFQNNRFITLQLSFKSGQIVCLEYQNTCLYGEVIQVIESRQLCWFRPLFIVINYWRKDDSLSQEELIDLRSSADLIWPTTLFRPSLDTECLAFLTQQNQAKQHLVNELTSRQYLHRFINRVWQANKDKF